MNSDSSHSGVENSWQNFSRSIPVLPCCEPDLSYTPWRGWMVWKPGNGPWPVQQPCSREPSRVWQPCLCPGHIPSPPTCCCCCSSAPSQGMDALLALTIPTGAAKISDLVQEELVPSFSGAQLRPSSALNPPRSCWNGQGWAGPAPGSSSSLSFGAGAARCGKLLSHQLHLPWAHRE